jgi:hypothetical protein
MIYMPTMSGDFRRDNALNSHKAQGDLCIISVDGNSLRVKLVHKNRGKFKIVDDT